MYLANQDEVSSRAHGQELLKYERYLAVVMRYYSQTTEVGVSIYSLTQ
jgi:hypothetical protein